MPDLLPIRRALLSVSDKTGLAQLARRLHDLGAELLSTGGTAEALRNAGLPVTPVEAVTGFPEILGGRVKTLHPLIHGGILALRDPDRTEHARALSEHNISPIDLVCVNLYPFERTVARSEVSGDEAVEQIDIGGPAMIRSAAKNAEWVVVLTDPSQCEELLNELDSNGGQTGEAFRRRLAAAAFARTAEYDAAIAAYLRGREGDLLPATLPLGYRKVSDLRYGENPHQRGAVYRDTAFQGPSVVGARQLHGRPLSYNNVLDASAAFELVARLQAIDTDSVAACVIKHTNPCGAAVGHGAAEAISAAIDGDLLAAYGGIVAVSQPIDGSAAEALSRPDSFFEVIVAPGIDQDALERLSSRSKHLRLLDTGASSPGSLARLQVRSVSGGVLVQEPDELTPDPAGWTHAAGPTPDRSLIRAAAVLDCIAGALVSNAVAIGGPAGGSCIQLFGAGAGQMDRLSASRLAVEKAGPRAAGAVAASDAFFPFPDGPRVLIEAGVRLIVHPGGSKRDEETFAICRERGVTCLTTGVRRFRH